MENVVAPSEVGSSADWGDAGYCTLAAMVPRVAFGGNPFCFVVKVVAKVAVEVGAVRSLRYMEVGELAVTGDVVGSSAHQCNSRWLPWLYVLSENVYISGWQATGYVYVCRRY